MSMSTQVISLTNYDWPESQKFYTKFRGNRSAGSGKKKIFEGFFKRNLVKNGHVVSEIGKF